MNLIDYFALICSQWGGGELADVTTVVNPELVLTIFAAVQMIDT